MSRNKVINGSLMPIAGPPTMTRRMRGATASSNGLSGIVPPPQAGDQDKVLKGSGTWGEAAADDNFVGSVENWLALPLGKRLKYKTADIDDDFNGLPVDSQLNVNSTNPIQNKPVAESIVSIDNNIEAIVNLYGSKNLLPNNASTSVSNGITFTVNSDGSITANGTSTAQCILGFATVNLKGGREYIYTDETNPSNITYFMNFMISGQSSTNINLVDLPYSFTVTEDTSYSFNLYVRSGQTLNNVVFKPMIRDARISDDTYIPYAMSNLGLTQYTQIAPKTLTTASSFTGTQIAPEYEMFKCMGIVFLAISYCYLKASFTRNVFADIMQVPNDCKPKSDIIQSGLLTNNMGYQLGTVRVLIDTNGVIKVQTNADVATDCGITGIVFIYRP